MNKSQLVDAIAKEAAITKVEAKKALDAFIAVTGTGAAIKIAPKKVVKFKAGAELSSLVK